MSKLFSKNSFWSIALTALMVAGVVPGCAPEVREFVPAGGADTSGGSGRSGGGAGGVASTSTGGGTVVGATGGQAGTGAGAGGRSQAGAGPAGSPGQGGAENPDGSVDLPDGGAVAPDAGGTSSEGGTGGETAGAGGESGGTGGTGGVASTDVKGQVLNHWLQPVTGVTVMIGTEETQTDADGKFEIASVDPEYDVYLDVRYKRYGNDGPLYGYVYQGLTRRDPTLQVYGGLSLRSGNLHFTPNNLTTGTNRVLVTALGGEFGAWSRNGISEVTTSMPWSGPESINVSAHGLLWEETDGLPTQYLSYDASPTPLVLVDGGGTADFSLDLADETLSSGSIAGSVTSPTTDERSNKVFVQFSSNAVIGVVDDSGPALQSDFSYTVPALPGASVVVAAIEGNSYRGALALAHKDGLGGGQNVSLAIPTPATLNAPADGTNVDVGATTFSWSGSSKTFVYHVESVNWYEGIYVVTANKQIKIPAFPNGLSLRSGETFVWRVETHQDFQSVDEMVGAEGFIDSFGSSDGDEPAGPKRTSGSYTISVGRAFDTP